MGEGCINNPYTIPSGKFLAHLGFSSKVLHNPLTDLSAWVGFGTSSPRQGVKFQPRYWGMAPRNISCKIPKGKVLAHLELRSKILRRLLTDISAIVGFCTSSPQQGVKCQLKQVVWSAL